MWSWKLRVLDVIVSSEKNTGAGGGGRKLNERVGLVSSSIAIITKETIFC